MTLHQANPEFEALLSYLKHSQGCDLTGYKRASLMRRFEHRMKSLDIDSYHTYLKYLQDHPKEHLELLSNVLINVTSFFRDGDAWQYLETDILPKIIASKQPNERIRVWSAGCASGQEIYSLLMLLAEHLGLEACLERVQSYATDLDEEAIAQARQGLYQPHEVADVPPHLLEKYFQPSAKGYCFHPGLRQLVVFGRHDLAKDAPMARIDLLLCRNVLIYCQLETQRAILTRFHFALKETGFLFLGKAEMLTQPRPIFNPVNLQQRVYTKTLKLDLEDYLSIRPLPRQKLFNQALVPHNPFWQTAFENSPIAQLAVDINGYLIQANEQANLLFGLSLCDWQQPFSNTLPSKLLSAHAPVKGLYCARQITLNAVKWSTAEGIRYFDVAIAPVFDSKKHLIGITLSFVEVTARQSLDGILKHHHSELTKATEALQVTESQLAVTRMELAAAYQEIQLLSGDDPTES